MGTTYSTLDHDLAGGKLFSSQSKRIQVGQRAAAIKERVPAVSAVPVVVSPTVPVVAPTPESPRQISFALTTKALPMARQIAPSGAGTVELVAQANGTTSVSGRITGVQPIKDPANRPTLWLIHDLVVPPDIAMADLAQLPKGPLGLGNQPGTTFTVDGNAPTYGTNSNTVAISISPGTFTMAPDGTLQISAEINPTTNQSFHPLAMLGPSVLANSHATMPSGDLGRILTDLYMRPATVHPELSLRTHFQQRIHAVTLDAATLPGTGGFLSPTSFTRAAVTLEGLVRSTPPLMPTRETCFLIS
jgi:hypothetical protein